MGISRINDTKSGALKYLKLTTRYAETDVFKLQGLLGKVLAHKYCETKVQEEQLKAKEQTEVDDF